MRIIAVTAVNRVFGFYTKPALIPDDLHDEDPGVRVYGVVWVLICGYVLQVVIVHSNQSAISDVVLNVRVVVGKANVEIKKERMATLNNVACPRVAGFAIPA